MLRERIGRCAKQLTGKLRNALRARIRDEGQRNDSELAAELGTTHDAFRKQIGRFRDAVEQCLLRHGIKFREVLRMTDEDLLIAEATTAWRPRTPDGQILEHPAWADWPRPVVNKRTKKRWSCGCSRRP